MQTEMTSLPSTSSSEKPRARAWQWVFLLAILLLAAYLRFSNLEALGYGNHYYTAAVTSMLKSWHNFFFVAAEPGGAVSVDKPPLGLWAQAAFAYCLGVSGFSVILPQILAGLLSILVLYHLVRRTWGAPAGLVAALALAITPVVIATDRNNTMDSQLILVLLLAAWAFIKATETGKLRYLLLGAALVGIGFNIKMLQAYLPLPAFFALYFLGSAERVWRKAGKLLLAALLLLVVSFSWVTIVDLVPAEQRPFVGSSGDNNEMSLAFGYNGMQRLLGSLGGGNRQASGPRTGNPPGGPVNGQMPFGNPPGGDGNNRPFGNLPAQPGNPPAGVGDNRPRQFGNNPGGGGVGNIGQAGALRLFVAPLGKEIGWLLPLGVFCLFGLAFSAKLTWPVSPRHQALALWGGWLLTAGIFFSVAGFFHEYYLSMLAAPLAALVGIGITQLWDLFQQRPRLASGLLLASGALTLGMQLRLAGAYLDVSKLLLAACAAFLIGAGLLGAGMAWKRKGFAAAGFAGVLCAMLIIPGAWSLMTMQNPTPNASLPSAYDGTSSNAGNRNVIQVNQSLLDYLQANTQDVEYLMAVPSSMQGADYVIATGRPVLYLGGFMGSDQVLTTDELANMVEDGRLRYVYYGGGMGGGGMSSQGNIAAWVTGNCTPIQGFDTLTSNFGTPDGTGGQRQGGNLTIALYDCGG